MKTNKIQHFPLWIAAGGVLMLVLAACSGLAGEPEIVATQPSSSSSTMLPAIGQNVTTSEVGSEIFAENCTACHGVEARGDGDMVKGGAIKNVPNLTDASSLTVKTPQEYFDVITNGRMDKMMPPWKDALSDKQRWAVADYVYQLGHPGALADASSRDASSSEPASTEEAPAVALAATETPVSAVTGTFSGTLNSGTAGMTLPTGLTATLHSVDSHFAETTMNATVAPDGSFKFEDVEIQTGETYVVTVNYQDEIFASASATGDLNQTSYDLPVTLYELSDDPALAQIDTLFSQISLEGDRLLVIQLASFSITGDRALRSVHLNIPEGATIENLSGSSQRYTVSEDGRQVIDTLTLVPGIPHTTHIGYSLPYTGDVTIVQPVDYALTNGFEVINDINGISIGGDGIQVLGGRSTGMSFGDNAALPAGTTIQFNVSGFPSIETTSSTVTDTAAPTSHILAYILIALGLISIGLALALALRERTPSQATDQSSDPNSRVNVLVREIAALDVEHQSGKLSDAAYEKRRYALKAQLMSLAKRAGATQD